MTDDERAIRALIAKWMAASAAGDRETVLGLMADDVVFLVAGRAPFGKQEFDSDQNHLENFRLEVNAEVREVHVTGDWAYCWTSLAVSMTPKSGGAVIRRKGHTLSIFRREQDGRWLLARDANLLAVEN